MHTCCEQGTCRVSAVSKCTRSEATLPSVSVVGKRVDPCVVKRGRLAHNSVKESSEGALLQQAMGARTMRLDQVKIASPSGLSTRRISANTGSG